MHGSQRQSRLVPAPDAFRLRRLLPSVAALVALALGGAAPALAASLPYGDFGPDFPAGIVSYQDVREDSGTDPVPPGRFGAPALAGDTLDFDPSGFAASATGAGSDVTDVQLDIVLDVQASHGAVAGGVSSILFSEAGEYSLLGAGSALTQVAAAVAVRIDILEVDGAPIAPLELFASSSIVRDLVSDGPVVLAPWSNGLLVEFGPLLAANGIDYAFGVTRAEITVADQLVAIGEPGSVAFAAKRDFAIQPDVVANPEFQVSEPAAAVLVLGCLAAVSRRSRFAA